MWSPTIMRWSPLLRRVGTSVGGMGGAVTARAVALGLAFALITTAMNVYLGINLGMGMGLGVVSIMAAYAVFSRLGGPSKSEVAAAYVISTSSLAVHFTLGTVIFLAERYGDVQLPAWLLPPNFEGGPLTCWLRPVLTIFALEMAATLLGLAFTVAVAERLNKEETMVYPNVVASASFLDACFEGSGAVRLVAVATAVGLVVTALQHAASALGLNLVEVDLTPLLPRGAILSASLSLGFAAVGYIVSSRVALSVLASGLVTYALAGPILVSRGVIEYSPNPQEMYNNLMFGFSLSPALGMLILGGIGLSLASLALRRVKGDGGGEGEPRRVGYLELYRRLWREILSRPRMAAVVVGLSAALIAAAYALNPFSPMPPMFSVAFAVYAILIASFLELVILMRMSGETGMNMGTTGIVLYDVPVFAAGYRGYAGYLAGGYFRPSPWTGPSVGGLMKYMERMGLRLRDIVLAKLIGWIPTFALSAVLTLELWRRLGFGNEQMPAIGLLQMAVYVRMLATGDLRATVNPLAFLAGGALGAVAEVLTPLSMTGLAIGMLLPPAYALPIAAGGVVRWITDRRYGREFFKERGILIATGVLASSILVQVTAAVLRSLI